MRKVVAVRFIGSRQNRAKAADVGGKWRGWIFGKAAAAYGSIPGGIPISLAARPISSFIIPAAFSWA